MHVENCLYLIEVTFCIIKPSGIYIYLCNFLLVADVHLIGFGKIFGMILHSAL